MTHRETINGIESNGTGYGLIHPLSGTPSVQVQGMTTALMADSGLPISISREMNPLQPYQNMTASHLNRCGAFTFLGDDISLQIQQQQMEIDTFIAHHTAKVQMEIENRRKRNSRRIIAAVEEGMLKRLRAKEEEIERIGKQNWALEEKVKSLSVENQIWRELAQTNEATANTLRTNLEQVLAHRQRTTGGCLNEATGILMDDCCGSNYEEDRLKLEEQTNSNRSCRNCFPPEISAPARFAIPPSTFFPYVNPPCPPFLVESQL